jgi:hypothetical protein
MLLTTCIGALFILVLLAASISSLHQWRAERRQARLLAERLITEGRLEALTLQTLQTMRHVARQQMHNRTRP